jgi:MFS transporter, MHS family, proline/betaine transporter
MTVATIGAGARRRAVAAATIGSALEWYDFIVYSFFAGTIGKLFFPSGDPGVQLLTSLAAFGVGFFMRPLGAIVLGTYGDRHGRRAAMTMTIALMIVGVTILTVAPTYAAIGIAGPALIVVARLFQGFSAGGEFASATSYLSEYAVVERRGFIVSWQQASQYMASLLAALVGALIARNLSEEAVASWGWRIPFALGLLIGPVGLYIRSRIEETPLFLQQERAAAAPLREALSGHWRPVLGGFGMVVYGTVSVYVLILFLPTYATTQFHMPKGDALFASAAMSALLIVLCIVAGAVADRIGRKPLVLGSPIAMLVLVYPLLRFFAAEPNVTRLLVIEAVFAVIIAAFSSPGPAMMAELFPTRVRNTALSLSYNFAVAIFGGFGQFIVAWLIRTTGDALAPSYYVLATSIVGIVAIWPLQDRTGKPLL